MKRNLQKSKCKQGILAVLLAAALALTAAGCGSTPQDGSGDQPSAIENQVPDQVLGEGQTAVPFIVIDGEGGETVFEIHTDKETVGEALLEQGLIAGEEGPYGLYVKEVNGITADYDADQTYWAFYINGEYAASGVDATPVKEGETYTFKVEK